MDIYDKMENLADRQKAALRLVERLVELDLDEGTTHYAKKMREHLKLPMSVVLAKLWPGIPVLEKCRRLGIARQAYYGWINGLYRPDTKLARRLAQLTGFDEDEIRGRLPPRR